MVEFEPVLLFSLIFLSVPLQFYLSPKSSDIKYHLTKFVDDVRLKLRPFYERIYGPTPEVDESDQNIEMLDTILEQDGISLAEGHFGSSEEPRDPRPPHIKFKVGQVFRHKKFKYRAVIIGWDEKAKAPDWWLKDIHKNNKEWTDNPNYLALIDTRDKVFPQIGYVIEENIGVVEDTSVIHPFLYKYFERFTGSAYILRPWLQRVYPFR